ncbi:MAG TPA: tRNA pseudouridine(38-40) synthase TruA, partial [Burkholderiaceae bacterium]|nr:tRNA pseudouridine(38-40) synthase TruA [Burkholderiaceae bacterium]
MRFALGLAYDGTAYPGWQTQPSGEAIQDRLEAALHALAGERVRAVCAGRTDAGVHALMQVVHFDTDAVRPLHAWVRGTNARLPPDIAVSWAREVPQTFDARFSARARSYRYLIYCGATRHPLWLHRAAWEFRPLALEPMRQAASQLVGTHDFTSFRSAECQAPSPVRTVQRLDVQALGEFVVVTITANAFLHHMVRNLVGTLLQIGSGRRPPQWAGELLSRRDRTLAAATHAPQGLYLAGV